MDTPVKTLEAFYKAVKDGDANAELLLELQNRYNGLFDFDPVSFENMPTTLDDMLLKYLARKSCGDRLYRIFLYVKDSLKFLLNELHTKILREHIVMPVRQVRETDGKTIRWLSKKPGRNIKEKLSGSYKLLAVRRLQSFDTAENRLLKALAVKLNELLFLRETCIQIPQDELDETLFLSRWVRSEDADCIGEWKNTPPNNTLLSDKHYKKAWIAWNALQHLDEDTAEDFLRLDYIRMSMTVLHFIGSLYELDACRFIQQPVRSSGYFTFHFALQKVTGMYGNDAIKIILPDETAPGAHNYAAEFLWNEQKKLLTKSVLARINSMQSIEQVAEKLLQYYKITNRTRKNSYNPFIADGKNRQKNADICTIDIAGIKPLVAKRIDTVDIQPQPIPFYLLQQFWQLPENSNALPVPCGFASSILLKNDTDTIKTFSIHHVLHTENNDKSDEPLVKEAAGIFVKALAAYLPCKTCIYLIPDSIDEFSSEIIRMNMNLYFHAAQNIPRSIAQLFTLLNTIREHTIQQGDYILIVDRNNRETVYTPLQAVVDKTRQLLKLVPETNGIIWERHPPITKVHEQYITTEEKKSECLHAAQSLFTSEDITDAPYLVAEETASFVPPAEAAPPNIHNETEELPPELKKHPYKLTIKIDKSNALCRGGMQFAKYQAELEKHHCPVPLWKDHLPNLTLKSLNDKITLVDENTEAVIPKRGATVPIPVKTRFEVPAGAAFCEFELIRGDGKQKEQFFAYLSNNRFPLNHPVTCSLNLQYTYGADNPYELFFIPTDEKERIQLGAFKAEWKKERQPIDLDSLPIPEYIKVYTLKEFREFKGRDGKEHDLFEWLRCEFKKIISVRKYGWKQYRINHEARNGQLKFFDINTDTNGICYQEKFVNRYHFSQARKGTLVSCYVIEPEQDKHTAQDITVNNEEPNKCFLRKSIRFPLFTVCRDGFSFFTLGEKFKAGIKRIIQSAEDIIATTPMPQTMKDEMRLFLSVLHKDTPESNIRFLENCLHDNTLLVQNEYWRNIAFALGDCSCPWQKKFFDNILHRIADKDNDDICLQILAIAFWRSQDFIFQLNTQHLQSILSSLDENLKKQIKKLKVPYISSKTEYDQTSVQKLAQYKRILSQYLELILALLRLRKEVQYRELLSPVSPKMEPIIKHLHALKKKRLALTSRIEFDISDSKIDKEDLTHIIEMYVLGDTKIKAIKIIGITEAEE